jgi:hypothetical protein
VRHAVELNAGITVSAPVAAHQQPEAIDDPNAPGGKGKLAAGAASAQDAIKAALAGPDFGDLPR